MLYTGLILIVLSFLCLCARWYYTERWKPDFKRERIFKYLQYILSTIGGALVGFEIGEMMGNDFNDF